MVLSNTGRIYGVMKSANSFEQEAPLPGMHPVTTRRKPKEIHETREGYSEHVSDRHAVEEWLSLQEGADAPVSQQDQLHRPNQEKAEPVDPNPGGGLKSHPHRVKWKPVIASPKIGDAGGFEESSSPNQPFPHGGSRRIVHQVDQVVK